MDDLLVINGKSFSSRLLVGTGKFSNKQLVSKSIIQSGTQIVTVAMRRIDLDKNEDNIVSYIPENITIMANTSGARTAKEAVRIARLAKAAGYGDWVKIEVINDSKYLLPDNKETVKATETLAGEGFTVLPYISPDLYTARELVNAGAAAVMPLGSLIGSNKGIRVKTLIEVLVNEIENIPVIVDAGIGRPSQAAECMEMGSGAVLVNTAIATSENPVLIAEAFSDAVAAGRKAYLAGYPLESETAKASSPLTGFLYE